MGEIGQGPAVGLTAGLEVGRGNQQRRHQRRAQQHDAHDERGRRQQFAGVADPAGRSGGRVGGVALDQRHNDDARLEARQTQSQRREDQQGRPDDRYRRRIGGRDGARPLADVLRVCGDLHETAPDDDRRQTEVCRDQHDRDPDGFFEALEEDGTEEGEQDQRDGDLLTAEDALEERVLDEVSARVGRRQGDRDDKAGRDEADEHEDEQFARPIGEQPFEHRQAAIAVRALLRDPPIHRQGPQQGDEHENEGGEWRQGSGRKRSDARLVAQGREIVDAGEAHDPPPRLGVLVLGDLALFLVEPARLTMPGVEEPREECIASLGCRVGDARHGVSVTVRRAAYLQ